MELKVRTFSQNQSDSESYDVLIAKRMPNGASADDAGIDRVADALAPSYDLASWFASDPQKWLVFCASFYRELKQRDEAAKVVSELRKKDVVALVHAEPDEQHNAAAALQQFFDHL